MKNLRTNLILVIISSLVFVMTLQAQITKNFQVKKGGTLEVQTGCGDINIFAWDKSEVRVVAKNIAEDDKENLSISQSGNTVSVVFKPDGSSMASFEISIPDQFDTDLKTAGGDIVFKGSISGTLKAKTAGGDIKMDNINGKIDMSTSGGDIQAGNISGDGSLSTSGGDIKLGTVGGTVKVSTAGGDIHVESVGKSVKASTAGGDIVLGNVGGEANASTAGGDVRVGKVSGKASLKTAGGDIELKGATGDVVSKTAGGSIKLSEIYGTVEASTAGGDVEAEILATGKGPSKMKTAGGYVKLYLNENVKTTIEARIEVSGGWNKHVNDCNIVSDFSSDNYKKDESKKEVSGTYIINGGGDKISLETVNSSIYIKKIKK